MVSVKIISHIMYACTIGYLLCCLYDLHDEVLGLLVLCLVPCVELVGLPIRFSLGHCPQHKEVGKVQILEPARACVE